MWVAAAVLTFAQAFPFLSFPVPPISIYPIPIRSILTLHSLDLFSFQIGWHSPSDNEERGVAATFLLQVQCRFTPSPLQFPIFAPPSLDFPRFRWANRESQVSCSSLIGSCATSQPNEPPASSIDACVTANLCQ